MKQLRTERQGIAMWKIFGEIKVHECFECKQKNHIRYLGFVKDYTPGLHAKIYQCDGCDTWIDVIWEKYGQSDHADV